MRILQLLQGHDFGDTVRAIMAETLNDRVRARLKEEIKRKHLSQRKVAHILNDPELQPQISRLLSGKQVIRLADLERLCFAVGIAPTEAVRDHGLEFCAEMSPTELRFLEALRALDPIDRDAVLRVLHVQTKTAKPERHAGPLVAKKSRPRN